MAKLIAAPTKNGIQKTLAAELLSTASTGDPITFDDVDGIPNLPGILVIDRVDANGTATPSKREYIEYSGTSGTTVLITTRNVDGSNSALTHAVGAVVEFVPDVVWADRMYDALTLVVDPDDNSRIRSFPFTEAVDAATIDFDLSSSTRHKVTLGGNRTLTVSNPQEGQGFLLRITQDETGERTVTWFDGISWAYGITPTLTTTGGKTDFFTFICTDATTPAFDGFVVGQDI